MKHLKESIIIFSTARTDNTETVNMENHLDAIEFLNEHDIPFRELEGCYKGILEKSIMLFADDEFIAHSLATRFNQDAYLYSAADRSTFIRTGPTDHGVYIGTLKPVSRVAAIKSEYWSKVGNQYYITEGV